MTKYTASIDTIADDHETWEATANNQAVQVSVPEEFGGSDDALTPEHLYALSLLNCYVATFRVIAKKSGLDYDDMSADITITLNPDDNPPVSDAEITLVYDGDDDAKTKHVARKARDHCYVHRSVKTQITISFNHV